MNILLLEPNYKNKYPPLGLMKIATFHKNLGDKVVFSKGENTTLRGTEWNRIYINSLFTFEWPATKKIIDFALTLTKNSEFIYLGGIAATLLPDEIAVQYSKINIVQGLLDTPGKLYLPNDETIDYLPPDYSILEQIDYTYPTSDAYFGYATRGCGMNCSFCAVQRLEPVFKEYISVKEQVEHVIKQCNEKRNLMLMDNNVLKSPRLADIVDEIVELGFGKNMKFTKPGTKIKIKRHVDFNQGLDANFLTEEKAALLAKLELDPVRIAFDHIQQKEKYVSAIRKCFHAGLRSFSNYLLYNTDKASWKGQSYGADTPEDLYNRLKFNVDLCEELNSDLKKEHPGEKAYIYSFPMRYIPLADMRRGYIGDNWDKKSLRAIQVFITPTQGKVAPSRSFFEASFGKTVDEFLIFLYAPEIVLSKRGELKFTKEERLNEVKMKEKIKKHTLNKNFVDEWLTIYQQLKENDLWDKFKHTYLKPNTFNFNIYQTITNPLEKKIYLYYLSLKSFKSKTSTLPSNEQKFITNFLSKDGLYLSKIIKNQ